MRQPFKVRHVPVIGVVSGRIEEIKREVLILRKALLRMRHGGHRGLRWQMMCSFSRRHGPMTLARIRPRRSARYVSGRRRAGKCQVVGLWGNAEMIGGG